MTLSQPRVEVTSTLPVAIGEAWAALTDLAAYEQWHPSVSFLDAPAALKEGGVIRARTTGGEYDFEIVHLDAPHSFAWRGGIPGVLTGRHAFVLEATPEGTRLTESEDYTGADAQKTVETTGDDLRTQLIDHSHALVERIIAIRTFEGTTRKSS